MRSVRLSVKCKPLIDFTIFATAVDDIGHYNGATGVHLAGPVKHSTRTDHFSSQVLLLLLLFTLMMICLSQNWLPNGGKIFTPKNL